MSRPKIKSKNNVKEGSCFKSIPVSSGRESYVPQVTPDRHQVTARKMKDKLNIATWNIRTLLQKGKLENIKQEMERMKLNILGLSEVRWKGAGKITSGGHEIIYSGWTESEKGEGIIVDQTVTKAIKGYWALSDRVLLVKIAGKPVDLNIIQVYAPTANSNDEDLDKLYNELDTAKTQCKSQDPLIMMGDFNAKVGTEKVDDIVGKHGLGIRNERGEKLIEWCQTNNIIVGNTWFQQPPRRKWTWKSPGDETRNQIDYMMISKRYRNALLLAKTYPNADCYSDHVPVNYRKCQATFLGHVMRRGKLEHLVTTGKFEGKRSRGRQREKIMDGLATWLGPGKVSDILAAVKDRDL
ncbi:craniofacial development protein 2-like protein [Plakobranchus ocellatus]|uniref:Craniofacial development protein 2-like protein n=1 Tax=Plakobranchus ocellatus TaxID=259542 RepID=A0AAV4BB84_9GAST|nr:craniofacial development protein 2-like protein [Plakobranchus ocellatus]